MISYKPSNIHRGSATYLLVVIHPFFIVHINLGKESARIDTYTLPDALVMTTQIHLLWRKEKYDGYAGIKSHKFQPAAFDHQQWRKLPISFCCIWLWRSFLEFCRAFPFARSATPDEVSGTALAATHFSLFLRSMISISGPFHGNDKSNAPSG